MTVAAPDESILLQAAQAVTQNAPKPLVGKVVEALLQSEKHSRQAKPKYQPEQLQGTWRLCLITGTQKARDRWELPWERGAMSPVG